MKDKNGFTLIEIIIVISLLSFMIVFLTHRINIDFVYMEKAANEFVSDVRYVQSENMKFPKAGYEIKIYGRLNSYYVTNNLVVEKTVVFKERYSIYFNNGDTVGFTYDGVPKKAGTFTIRDTKTKKIKQISIVPVTGRTIILE